MESAGVGQGFMWPTPDALGAGKTTRRACLPVASWQFSHDCDERELEKSTESWSSLLGHKKHLNLVYLGSQSGDLRLLMVFNLAMQKEPSLFKVYCNTVVSNF